jgi:hypothetical protein
MADILAPLRPYFAAVNSDVANDRLAKAGRVAAAFAPDGVVIDQEGHEWRGTERIQAFYSSPKSPVGSAGFKATPHPEFAAAHGSLIAVEITLHVPQAESEIRVGDFFTVEHGKITRLAVFKSFELKQ